jgi:Pyruvate/2-oxoacid:ferredoxin oxidoreductase gamma subunit
VVSHLEIYDAPHDESNKVGQGAADVYPAFDLLGGAKADNLSHANKTKTVAIVSTSAVATGSMVRKTTALFPEQRSLRRRIDEHTAAAQNLYLDTNVIAERLFRTHMAANMIFVGAAFQRGLLPLSADSIEHAIELKGESVETNKNAFRVGRKIAEHANTVRWVTPALMVGGEIDPSTYPLLRRRLAARGVICQPEHTITAAAHDTVTLLNVITGETTTLNGIGAVVIAGNKRAANELFYELQTRGLNVSSAGDCIAPRTVTMAIYEGEMAGRAV